MVTEVQTDVRYMRLTEIENLSDAIEYVKKLFFTLNVLFPKAYISSFGAYTFMIDKDKEIFFYLEKDKKFGGSKYVVCLFHYNVQKEI